MTPSERSRARKEWPLLFSAPMVRAILARRKTVTRRLDKRLLGIRKGDVIWGRETWRTTRIFDDLSPVQVGQRCLAAGWKQPWAPVLYCADGTRVNWEENPDHGKIRVSIHMPRWLSRLILVATEDAREERLQEITEEEAVREGVESEFMIIIRPAGTDNGLFRSYRDGFRRLWDELHPKPGERWQDNPTVVRVAFELTV